MNKEKLLSNIDKIHTTDMGIDRISKNLKLNCNDVVDYCKKKYWIKIVTYINKVKIGTVK